MSAVVMDIVAVCLRRNKVDYYYYYSFQDNETKILVEMQKNVLKAAVKSCICRLISKKLDNDFAPNHQQTYKEVFTELSKAMKQKLQRLQKCIAFIRSIGANGPACSEKIDKHEKVTAADQSDYHTSEISKLRSPSRRV